MSRYRSTHNGVVLAADRIGIAVTSANSDNGDGRAGETDQGVHALNDNTEQAKKSAGSGVAGLFTAHIVSHFIRVAAYE